MLERNIFREYDIRGVTGKDLNPDVARLVARGYAAFLAARGVSGAIAVGRDNRPSGNALHAELVAGLLESGLDVVDIGVVPTPLAYWAQHKLDVVGVSRSPVRTIRPSSMVSSSASGNDLFTGQTFRRSTSSQPPVSFRRAAGRCGMKT